MKLIFIATALLTLTAKAQDKAAEKAPFKNTFSHESSLSAVQTGGNAVSDAYNAATTNIYKTEPREYKLYGNYNLAYAEIVDANGNKTNEETARNWQIGLGTVFNIYEKIGLNTGIMFEGNTFAGYKQRENLDLGTKYTFHDTDKLKSFTEIGYRYVIEKRTARDEDGEDVFYFNKANLYYEIEQKLNESVSYKFWVQYLPNFTEPDDYQINFEPSLSVIMTSMLSLKVAYKGQYDNELNPGVEEYLDHTTTTSLVAKF